MNELVWTVVCTAVFGPDLRSNAHSTSRVFFFFFLFFHFSIVSVDRDLGFKAPHQINKKSSSARFRLDGLDWSFRLMGCSSLRSVKSGGLRSFIGVFLTVFKDKILTQGLICGPKMTFSLS